MREILLWHNHAARPNCSRTDVPYRMNTPPRPPAVCEINITHQQLWQKWNTLPSITALTLYNYRWHFRLPAHFFAQTHLLSDKDKRIHCWDVMCRCSWKASSTRRQDRERNTMRGTITCPQPLLRDTRVHLCHWVNRKLPDRWHADS